MVWQLPPNVVPSSLAAWCTEHAGLFCSLASRYLGSPLGWDRRAARVLIESIRDALTEALDCGTIHRQWKAWDWLTGGPVQRLQEIEQRESETMGDWGLVEQRDARLRGAILDLEDLLRVARAELEEKLFALQSYLDQGDDVLGEIEEADAIRRILGKD